MVEYVVEHVIERKVSYVDTFRYFMVLILQVGEGMWESNPPWNVLGPKLGFEDR